jgi:ATP:ADP antiporter, AAA family
MFQTASSVRPEERRAAWQAFFTLFAVMTAHALFETARDALFLSSIPAARLPWVYLMVAGVSVAIVQRKDSAGRGLGRSMGTTLGTASVLSLALWALLPLLGKPGLYALYVFSSVLVTLVLIGFWTAMGNTFTVRQAKRLYAFVGMGSVSGAIAGFALAGLASQTLAPRHLLLLAAVMLAGAAVVSNRHCDEHAAEEPMGAQPGLLESFRRPYVSAVAAVILIGTVATTVGDYIFKAAVADAVPSGDLASTFALIYLALNVISLAVQAFLVTRIVQRAGVTTSQAVLPGLMIFGTLGVAAGGGIAAAILLKGADGALRHTLHKTATELLFVPMPERIRTRVKGLIDVVGQRGGQALASVGILIALALGAGPAILAFGLLGLIAAWIGLVMAMRDPYADVFRRTLDDVVGNTNLEYPDLDLASLETVMKALNSTSDRRVVAALEILKREGKVDVVPALLLYHPSSEVVSACLDLFTEAGRTDFFPIADRLQGNANPTVHAAIVRAKSALAPNIEELTALTSSHCRATRTTANTYLLSLGEIDLAEATTRLDHLLDHENRRTAQLAIARAAPYTRSPLIDGYLIEMLDSSDWEVVYAALESMHVIESATFIPPLLGALGHREVRDLVCDALVKQGPAALAVLDRTLSDPSVPEVVRWEIPGAIAQFGGARALDILLRHLLDARGMVEFRTILALEHVLNAEPDLTPPSWGETSGGEAGVLEQCARRTLRRAFRFIDLRLQLEAGAREDERFVTTTHAFLVRLLADKESHAIDRLILLLGLTSRGEDFRRVRQGLRGKQARLRSSSLELLDLVVPQAIRGPVMGLLDSSSDERRLASADTLYTPTSATYIDVLETLLGGSNEGLQALAIAQIGEIGDRSFQERLEGIDAPAATMLDGVLNRARALLAAEAVPA